MKIKKIYAVFVLSIVSALYVYAQQDDFPVLKGPYLGQKPPGSIPEIFAPGIVSTEENRELGGCAFSPDGKECYFTRAIENDWVIFFTRWENEGWTVPEPVKFSAGTTALYPHITHDNRLIIWEWRGRRGPEDYGIYMSRRTA